METSANPLALAALRVRGATAKGYAASTVRLVRRGGTPAQLLGRAEDRLVFVVGSPRSGTTFLGGALGAAPGFVDLGEVLPLKAITPELGALPEAAAAARIRTVLERVRLLGLVRGLRGVEQTPEMAYFVPAAARAYPHGRFIHLIRDGRDVVCSLLERGWLKAGRLDEPDDIGRTYGNRARFWVEPERADEFAAASDATRAAWAWRRYASAARAARGPAVLELRYEQLAHDPEQAAEAIGEHLGVPAGALVPSLSQVHAQSVGRFREDLTADQLADVEKEAGALLAELGYL